MIKETNIRGKMFSLVSTWKDSGLSQKSFCKRERISYHVFHYWLKRWKDHNRSVSGFIPVKVSRSTTEVSGKCIEIVYPDGKRLFFHDLVEASYLKYLLE
jgi:hypothetical protein